MLSHLANRYTSDTTADTFPRANGEWVVYCNGRERVATAAICVVHEGVNCYYPIWSERDESAANLATRCMGALLADDSVVSVIKYKPGVVLFDVSGTSVAVQQNPLQVVSDFDDTPEYIEPYGSVTSVVCEQITPWSDARRDIGEYTVVAGDRASVLYYRIGSLFVPLGACIAPLEDRGLIERGIVPAVGAIIESSGDRSVARVNDVYFTVEQVDGVRCLLLYHGTSEAAARAAL